MTIESGVVVTGGASGIGKACAEFLAAAGRPVAVWDLNGAAAKEVASSLGVPAIGLEVDVTGDLTDAVAATREALPSIGGLVHSAGMVDPAPIDAVDWDKWDRLMSVNLTAEARLVQLLLPDFEKQAGSAIVGIASIEGLLGHAFIPSYCASKAGLIGLTRSLADYLGPKGIRVNAVCPGYIDTPMLNADENMKAGYTASTVLRRMGQPADIAGAVRFLLSEDASFITGQAIAVDGGVTAVDRPFGS